MDVYFEYNQIPMREVDKDKTAFMTKHVNYWYKVTSFSLMNENATY